MPVEDRTKAWQTQFFPVREIVILDKNRPAKIFDPPTHGIKVKVKEKKNASTHSRKSHRRK